MTFWKFVHHGSIHDGCWHAVADFTCRDLCDRAAAPARQAGLYTSMGLQTISDGFRPGGSYQSLPAFFVMKKKKLTDNKACTYTQGFRWDGFRMFV